MGSSWVLSPMSWEFDFEKCTAKQGGYAVKFVLLPTGSSCGSDCFRDPEGSVWRGNAMPGNSTINNEALRMRMLHDAADAYGKALRKAVDPFPADQ